MSEWPVYLRISVVLLPHPISPSPLHFRFAFGMLCFKVRALAFRVNSDKTLSYREHHSTIRKTSKKESIQFFTSDLSVDVTEVLVGQ